MNCQDIQRKLFENLPLTREEEAHLAQCRECRQTAAILAPRPSPALDVCVRAACKAQLRHSHRLRRLLWPAVAAAALLLLCGPLWRTAFFRTDGQPTPHVAVSAPARGPEAPVLQVQENTAAQVADSLDFDASVQIVNAECNKIQLELDVLACGM